MPFGKTHAMPGKTVLELGKEISYGDFKDLHIIITASVGVIEAIQAETVEYKVNPMSHI